MVIFLFADRPCIRESTKLLLPPDPPSCSPPCPSLHCHLPGTPYPTPQPPASLPLLSSPLTASPQQPRFPASPPKPEGLCAPRSGPVFLHSSLFLLCRYVKPICILTPCPSELCMSDSHPPLVWVQPQVVELGKEEKQGEVESFLRWLFRFSRVVTSRSDRTALDWRLWQQEGGRMQLGEVKRAGNECKAGRGATGGCLPGGCLPRMPDRFSCLPSRSSFARERAVCRRQAVIFPSWHFPGLFPHCLCQGDSAVTEGGESRAGAVGPPSRCSCSCV